MRILSELPGENLGTLNIFKSLAELVLGFKQFRLAKAEAGTGNAIRKSNVEELTALESLYWGMNTLLYLCTNLLCCYGPLKSCAFYAWLLLSCMIFSWA